MWPTIAASPAAAGSAVFGLSRAASHTLAAPFAMSSAATITPAVTPDTRMTFAAPRLPLPARRRSPAPHRRDRISANGIDPRRYAARITTAIITELLSLALGPLALPLDPHQQQARQVERGLRGLKLH